jgi:coenzyme PQQ precursor peptide PqqA
MPIPGAFSSSDFLENPCVTAPLLLVFNGSILNIGCFRDTAIKGGSAMAWTTPKVFEICVGLEINSYACAEI